MSQLFSNQMTKKVKDSLVTMTEIVLPVHTNSFGTIFGGVIMSWIDIAGAVVAQRHSQKVVVTASVDEIHFIAPAHKGWVVNLNAHLNYTSRTSMEVEVYVEAENPRTSTKYQTVRAYLTFVALDDQGRPTEIPQLVPETSEEKQRFKEAEQRRLHRLSSKSKAKNA